MFKCGDHEIKKMIKIEMFPKDPKTTSGPGDLL